MKREGRSDPAVIALRGPHRDRPRRSIRRVASWLLMIVFVAASGAGFALFEHSGRGLGSAFAGEAAGAEDASTVYYNPAGLTLLSGTQFVSSGFAIITSTHFENSGSATFARPSGRAIPICGR